MRFENVKTIDSY